MEKSGISKRKERKMGKKRDMKQCEINRKPDVVRDRNEENREIKQYERILNREKVEDEDNKSGTIFEMVTGNKK